MTEFSKRERVGCEAVSAPSSGIRSQIKWKTGSYEWYRYYLSQFARSIGVRLQIGSLKPLHISNWLGGETWNDSTKYNAVRAVIRAIKWAIKEGRLKENPLKGVERPIPKRRETFVSKEQFKLLVCLSSPVTPLIAKWQVARNEPPAILHNCRSILQVENSLLREAMRLGSMIFDMTLVRSAKDEQARQADQEFVDALPKTFHSQGERAVAVSLHAGVKMEVDVRYDHRFKNQAYRRNRKAKHGLSPALLRLVRHRDCLVFEMNQSTRIGEDVITEELCHRIVKRMDYDNPIVAILNWPEIRPPTAETDSANTLR